MQTVLTVLEVKAEYIDPLTNEIVSDHLEDVLPSGSGLNDTWTLYTKDNDKTLYLSSSFHAMDQNGYCDGYADFTVKIPLTVSPDQWYGEFTLQFNGKYSHYLNVKHGLREYLKDTISNALKGLQTVSITTTYVS